MPVLIGIDARGDGVLVWQEAGSGAGFRSSSYVSATQSWSAAVIVPGSEASDLGTYQIRMAMSTSGQAVLAWLQGTKAASGSSLLPITVQTARYVPGGAAGAGWRAAESVHSAIGTVDLALAANDADQTLVAWIDGAPAGGAGAPGPLTYGISARLYQPQGGWQPQRDVVTGSTRDPRQLKLALNTQGAAVLVWRNAYDKSVEVSQLNRQGEWSSQLKLYSPDAGLVGDPAVLQPFMTDDGRALVSWVPADPRFPAKLMTASYAPATEWGAALLRSFVGGRGNVVDIDLAFNRAGQGVVFWTESNGSTFDLYANPSLNF